jgi:hypothetical protein
MLLEITSEGTVVAPKPPDILCIPRSAAGLPF